MRPRQYFVLLLIYSAVVTVFFVVQNNSAKRNIVPIAINERNDYTTKRETQPAHIATAAVRSQNYVTIENVTITIKTTKRFYDTRVKMLLKTWMKHVLNQSFFISDADDEQLKNEIPDGHLVVTHCGSSHSAPHLCCKTSSEFDTFVHQNKSWWCHFDDDAYVNIESLLLLLNNYDPNKDLVYLGRQSVDGFAMPTSKEITKILRREVKGSKFLTGAGYCISRALGTLLEYWIGKGRLVEMCRMLRLNDDMAVGVIIVEILKVPMEESFLFHSPYDNPSTLAYDLSSLKEQVMFVIGGKNKPNLANLDPHYDVNGRWETSLNIHCILNPNDVICKS